MALHALKLVLQDNGCVSIFQSQGGVTAGNEILPDSYAIRPLNDDAFLQIANDDMAPAGRTSRVDSGLSANLHGTLEYIVYSNAGSVIPHFNLAIRPDIVSDHRYDWS